VSLVKRCGPPTSAAGASAAHVGINEGDLRSARRRLARRRGARVGEPAPLDADPAGASGPRELTARADVLMPA
jgi:hypothetical protein